MARPAETPLIPLHRPSSEDAIGRQVADLLAQPFRAAEEAMQASLARVSIADLARRTAQAAQ